MATIAFLIEHEEGHLNPTFRLARRLAAREHRVVYLGLADGGDFVRAQGFEFFPILEDVFPRGTLRTLREMMRTAAAAATTAAERSAEIAATLQAVRETPYARTWKGLLDAGPELDRMVAALRPDLFVLTSLFVPHALVLHSRFRRPVVLLNPVLRTEPKSEYAAGVIRLMMEIGETKERIGALLPPPSRPLGLPQRLLVHILRLRELILCPADFELPGESWEGEPEVYYVEPTVDLERRAEGAFPWEALDPARRLVYVSLGSQSHRAGAERVKAFLHAAAAGFAGRPDWQVVISTGGLLELGEIATTSSGGIVTGWAPQLDLLDRAAVMVTHGGMGAVKECIVRGVPMAVFPIDHDQPDNARRVVHHQLGVSGDLSNATAGEIVALVEQADRPAVRESMAKMRQRFLDVEGSGIGVRRIEELLEGDHERREERAAQPGGL